MADTLTPKQLKFVTTFIGARASGVSNDTEAVGPVTAAWEKTWKDARLVWQTASDSIDLQISALQSKLKGSDDPELQEIGEFGLNAITGNRRVRVMAAMRDLDGLDSPPDKGTISKVSKTIEELESHIDNDDRIAAVDNNPFGVTVSVAKSISSALAQVKTALHTGLAAR